MDATWVRPLTCALTIAWGTVGAAAGSDWTDLRSQLGSPYRGERERALQDLRIRVEREPALLDQVLTDSAASVRRAGAALLSPDLSPDRVRQVANALVTEPDASVREAFADVLGQAADGPAACDAVRAAFTERPESTGQYWADRILLAQFRGVFDELIRDGDVPGFYDGQFAQLWPLGPEVRTRLLEVAFDPSHHFTIRIMAVMALHERRVPTLEKELSELIQRESREFETSYWSWFAPRASSVEELWTRRESDLSRYCRFALAKAGMTGPIERMIAEMDRQLLLRQSKLTNRGALTEFEEYERDFLISLLFETGYYYQQFDDYDRASQRYQQVVTQFPDSRTCQNAFYNLACIASIQRRIPQALSYLKSAVERGFTDFEWLLEDGDLEPLRGNPEFLRVVELARRGGAIATGLDWMTVVTPHLPPGVPFFEATNAQRREALQRAGGDLQELGDAILRETPPSQRESTLEVLRNLGYGG